MIVVRTKVGGTGVTVASLALACLDIVLRPLPGCGWWTVNNTKTTLQSQGKGHRYFYPAPPAPG